MWVLTLLRCSSPPADLRRWQRARARRRHSRPSWQPRCCHLHGRPAGRSTSHAASLSSVPGEAGKAGLHGRCTPLHGRRCAPALQCLLVPTCPLAFPIATCQGAAIQAQPRPAAPAPGLQRLPACRCGQEAQPAGGGGGGPAAAAAVWAQRCGEAGGCWPEDPRRCCRPALKHPSEALRSADCWQCHANSLHCLQDRQKRRRCGGAMSWRARSRLVPRRRRQQAGP